MTPAERPALVILARKSGDELSELFSKRGFLTTVVEDASALAAALEGEPAPAAVILDFETPDAHRALSSLSQAVEHPVLIGIARGDEDILAQDVLDAAFSRPVNPARLFTRLVKLLAQRRRRGRPNRITGVVGVVRGNQLFHRVEKELHDVVPPINAGAILEQALAEIGTEPRCLAPKDLAALLASGHLVEALTPFGDEDAIRQALARIQGLVR